MLSSSLVAFGFSRLRFPGRDRLFSLLIATMMLPGIVTLLPSYIGFRYLHWIDTLYPLIVPSFFSGAFNVFLLRQFFMTLPRELDEAARLDGATYFQIYWKILMPLCRPALVTVGLFAFIYAWKDLMAPLIYLNSVENHTLELGPADLPDDPCHRVEPADGRVGDRADPPAHPLLLRAALLYPRHRHDRPERLRA